MKAMRWTLGIVLIAGGLWIIGCRQNTAPRVAGTQEQFLTVTVLNPRIVVEPNSAQPGPVTLRIINNSSHGTTVMVQGNSQLLSTNMLEPGDSQLLAIADASTGEYLLTATVPGQPNPVTSSFVVTDQQVTPSGGQASQGPRNPVQVTITTTGVQIAPTQMPPGQINLTITNNDTVAHTVTVAGAGFTQSTPPVQPGNSTTLTIPKAQQGQYQISAPAAGKQPSPAETGNLRVGSPSGTPATSGNISTVVVSIVPNGVQMTPSIVPPGDIQMVVSNLSNQPRSLLITTPTGQQYTATMLLQPTATSTVLVKGLRAGQYTITAPLQGQAPSAALHGLLTLDPNASPGRVAPSSGGPANPKGSGGVSTGVPGAAPAKPTRSPNTPGATGKGA